MKEKNPSACPVSNTVFLKLLLLLTFGGRVQVSVLVWGLRLMRFMYMSH